jgi:hypothetical protein
VLQTGKAEDFSAPLCTHSACLMQELMRKSDHLDFNSRKSNNFPEIVSPRGTFFYLQCDFYHGAPFEKKRITRTGRKIDGDLANSVIVYC